MTIASVGLLRDTKLSYVSITIKMGTFSDPNVVQQKGVNLTFKGPQSLRRWSYEHSYLRLNALVDNHLEFEFRIILVFGDSV